MKIPYTVERSIIIKTTPRKAYSLARDMNQAAKWSPWFVMEPGAAPKVEGDGKKVGSLHTWDGPILGAGEQELVELKADKLIRHDLRFFSPFKSTAQAEMTFKKMKTGTKVTWRLDSTLPFFMFPIKKLMVALIAKDYDRGLSMLKQYLETGEVHSKVKYEGTEEAEGFQYFGIKRKCSLDKVGDLMGKDIVKMAKWIDKNNVQAKIPFSIYHKYDFVKETCVYTSGFMVKEIPKDLPKEFITGKVKGGKAFVVEHKGIYQNLGNAWTGGMMYLRAHKIKQRKGVHPLEVYCNDPWTVKPQNIRTKIYFPVK